MKYIRIPFFLLVVLLFSACASEKEEPRQILTPPEVSIPTQGQSFESAVPVITTVPDSELSEPDPQDSEKSVNSQSKEIKLYLNGNKLPLEQKPLLVDNNVMIPVAEICTYFSRSITSEQNNNTLTIIDEKKDNKIIITAGEKIARINNKDTEMLVPAVLSDNGVMLVELSSVRILLDADSKFNSEFSSAYINESGLC
jgi:hypothetical protein